MKKILVAGGAGFIGSNLCRILLDQGHHIICIDNLYTGSRLNIEPLIQMSNFSFIIADIEDYNTLQRKLYDAIGYNTSIEEIYNLACPASPPQYQKSPTKTIKTNVIGTMNLLELANKHNSKFLQASTSEVYGDPLEHPQTEGYRGNVNPIGIRACYDEGKRCAETLCFDYNREFGTRVKVIRIFNTYGPNMDPNDGRVISNFIVQALNNMEITIYGSGNQTRSFCYIDDLLDGMVRMMESEDEFLGPVNIGNPNEFTIIELAEKILSKTKSESEVIYLPLPMDDPTQRKPAIELAVDRLGWEPKIDLDTGLELTIRYYKELSSHTSEVLPFGV